ncbi:sigma-70 family RNA polymerase sigma factor [Bacteroidia bacterium]|nr:sigma-70 family RNA polymerase sigma factor [Bacteroidia bacterium]MDB4107891.1 sigma-70 family RNA polymerase sigma factor [Bacteroidia bacterium]MDB9883390.1 sigma-70 family RNA polymerase sigma factor [Bacteroidia bacterium]
MSTNEQYNEISLIKACSNGDNKAFKKIYDKHSGIMYSICLRYMTNEDEAKDALQEGFIKVFKNIGKFSFSGSFEGWMKRIFVNTSIELIRKRRAHLDVSELNTNEIKLTSKIETGTMDAEKMMLLVQQLPMGYRTVFNMFVVDGYSHKEISEYLGINENTSKSQLFKARKQLQVWLKDWFK